MLKALGFSKKKPPKESQIEKHKEQCQLRDKWEDDTRAFRQITDKLRDAYKHSKGDFAMNRYEELKVMLKGAIQEYKQALEDSKGKALARRLDKSGDRYGSGKAMARLKENAEKFASQQPEQQENRITDYSTATAKEVDKDLEELRKEILDLKSEYFRHKDRLGRLDTQYQDSKKHKPPQRYSVMKNMIKVATET